MPDVIAKRNGRFPASAKKVSALALPTVHDQALLREKLRILSCVHDARNLACRSDCGDEARGNTTTNEEQFNNTGGSQE